MQGTLKIGNVFKENVRNFENGEQLQREFQLIPVLKIQRSAHKWV
jgi:hypothetical protein